MAAIGLYQALRIEQIQRDLALDLEGIRSSSNVELESLRNDVAMAQLSLEEKIESARVSIEEGQLQLELSRFEADEKARRDAIIQEYVPLLLSPDPSSRETAVAVLLVTYPEEAQEIIETVAKSRGEEYVLLLAPQIELASAVAKALGDWIVVVANDIAFDDADKRLQAIEDRGYSVAIYGIERLFVTAIGPFPTKQDAEAARIAARAEISRGAYLLNLEVSCPVQELIDKGQGRGYFNCFLDS